MKKIAIIFGGMSTENEISEKSAQSILNNLDKTKYKITQIYIDKTGKWYNYETKEEIENIVVELKKQDKVFPVLHGLYGEDGTIQGMLELFKIPYVGCKVLASSIGMDKVYSKIIFEKAGINQAEYIYIKVPKTEKYILVNSKLEEKSTTIEEISKLTQKKLQFPVFVKPSNSGSSIGITKANNKEELKTSIENAAKYDSKILIEKAIKGRELECAVLENEKLEVEVSEVGEILPAENFYSYNAKYNNQKSQTQIPAKLENEKVQEIKQLAIKAFKAIDGKGLSRVDFFLEEKTEKVYLNEINTMPGFTNISMYPKLMEHKGYTYSQLLDKLIERS